MLNHTHWIAISNPVYDEESEWSKGLYIWTESRWKSSVILIETHLRGINYNLPRENSFHYLNEEPSGTQHVADPLCKSKANVWNGFMESYIWRNHKGHFSWGSHGHTQYYNCFFAHRQSIILWPRVSSPPSGSNGPLKSLCIFASSMPYKLSVTGFILNGKHSSIVKLHPGKPAFFWQRVPVKNEIAS